jgi:hypothetical protein
MPEEVEMRAKPQQEHAWLQKLVGSWESEAEMSGDGQSIKAKGKEEVRSLGGLWVLCEGQGEMPDGTTGSFVMTIGYNPDTKRYVGTWVGSMMANMWIYDGEMSADGKTLTLNSTGPHMTEKGKTAKYQDIIEIVSENERKMRSQWLDDNGKWQQFMTVRYWRKK